MNLIKQRVKVIVRLVLVVPLLPDELQALFRTNSAKKLIQAFLNNYYFGVSTSLSMFASLIGFS